MTDRPTPLDPPTRAEGEPRAEAEPDPGQVAEADGQPATHDQARERVDDRSVWWGSTRRRVASVVAGLVLVAAVVTTVVVATSDAPRPVPRGEIPLLESQFASPPPAPTGTAGPVAPALPAYAGGPLWTFQLPTGSHDDDVPEFAVTDPGFLLRFDDEVRMVDAAGKQLWRHAVPDGADVTVRATASVVLVGRADPNQDRWPQPDVIVALDAATGTQLWQETEASFWSLTTETLYLSVCYGGQNNRVGDCRFSARDPRTNAVRWTVPTYASARVINAGGTPQAEPPPPVLLVESYPTGADSIDIVALDPATGARRGRGFTDAEGKGPSIDVVTERTVVTIDDYDDNPANGCAATVTGFSTASGARTWQFVARTAKTDDGRRCAPLPVSYNGGKLGVTSQSGQPSVLNVDTGAVEWTAPVTGQGLAAAGTTLLAVEPGAAGGADLVAYRTGNPQPVWRTPFHGEIDHLDDWNVRVTGTAAIMVGLGDEAVGYDLATGTGWSYGPRVEQETATWFATCGGGVCRSYATA